MEANLTGRRRLNGFLGDQAVAELPRYREAHVIALVDMNLDVGDTPRLKGSIS